MKHMPLEQLGSVAHVTQEPRLSRDLRRERLARFASALDHHTGPIALLPRIEYMTRDEQMQMRSDNSVLTVAYQDPVLRSQGLISDRLGAAMAFFGLSRHEAHYLFCDCHFAGPVSGQAIAQRVRYLARHKSLAERWENFSSRVQGWYSRLAWR